MGVKRVLFRSAQAKKGGSRRQGAKAFDVDVAVVKDGEDQEQLAALAPLIRRCAPPSPASGRSASSSGRREKGWVPLASGPAPRHCGSGCAGTPTRNPRTAAAWPSAPPLRRRDAPVRTKDTA